jgi:small subunit ribosomal protein S20
MANLKSSKKDIRRTARRTARNQTRRTQIQTAIKVVRSAASPEAAQGALRELTVLLDRGAREKLIHWRKAARQKSRMAAFLAGKFPASQAT